MAQVPAEDALHMVHEYVKVNASDLLTGTTKFTLSPSLLSYLNKRFTALQGAAQVHLDHPDATVHFARFVVRYPEWADVVDLLNFFRLVPALCLEGSRKKDASPVGSGGEEDVQVDLTPFVGLKQLEVTAVRLAALKGLDSLHRQLTHVVFRDGAVRSLDEVVSSWEKGTKVSWTALETLSCQYNNLTHLTPALGGLPLRGLQLSHNRLHKVEHLQGCHNLSHLDLGFNRIASVAGIRAVVGQISVLILRNNALVSTEGLECLYSLEQLDLSNNVLSAMEEVERISALPNLSSLSMEGNPIAFASHYRISVFVIFKSTERFVLDGTIASGDERVILARERKRRSLLEPRIDKDALKVASPTRVKSKKRSRHRVVSIYADDGTPPLSPVSGIAGSFTDTLISPSSPSHPAPQSPPRTSVSLPDSPTSQSPPATCVDLDPQSMQAYRSKVETLRTEGGTSWLMIWDEFQKHSATKTSTNESHLGSSAPSGTTPTLTKPRRFPRSPTKKPETSSQDVRPPSPSPPPPLPLPLPHPLPTSDSREIPTKDDTSIHSFSRDIFSVSYDDTTPLVPPPAPPAPPPPEAQEARWGPAPSLGLPSEGSSSSIQEAIAKADFSLPPRAAPHLSTDLPIPSPPPPLLVGCGLMAGEEEMDHPDASSRRWKSPVEQPSSDMSSPAYGWSPRISPTMEFIPGDLSPAPAPHAAESPPTSESPEYIQQDLGALSLEESLNSSEFVVGVVDPRTMRLTQRCVLCVEGTLLKEIDLRTGRSLVKRDVRHLAQFQWTGTWNGKRGALVLGELTCCILLDFRYVDKQLARCIYRMEDQEALEDVLGLLQGKLAQKRQIVPQVPGDSPLPAPATSCVEETYLHLFKTNFVMFGSGIEDERAVFLLVTDMHLAVLEDVPEQNVSQIMSTAPSGRVTTVPYKQISRHKLSELKRINVGLYFQYFRLEYAQECHVFLTRDKECTSSVLGKILKVLAQYAPENNPPVVNCDRETIDRIQEQIRSLESVDGPVLYRGDIPVVARTLILTDTEIFLCQEDLTHWPPFEGSRGRGVESPQFRLLSFHSLSKLRTSSPGRDDSNRIHFTFKGEKNEQWDVLMRYPSGRISFFKELTRITGRKLR